MLHDSRPATPSRTSLRTWEQLSSEQRLQTGALSITQAQIEYAGSVAKQLEGIAAESGTDGVGLAILDQEVVVGFLALKRRTKAPDWATPGAAVISGMRIDQSVQGRRLGTSALLELPAWVRHHWPECTELALSVDEDNAQAIRAYSNAGFADLGQRAQGRIGWVRYMSKPLSVNNRSEA
jgi:RimJ/RimL family protein N-acetyltransferase